MVKVVIQNTRALPIQKEMITLPSGSTFTSPQNFQPFNRLTLDGVLYLYYNKPFKVIKDGMHVQIVPAEGKGWHKDTPGHKRAATKTKLKTTLRTPHEPNRESPEEIAARHIRDSPNSEWKRKYRIVSVRNIAMPNPEKTKIYNGRIIVLEFTEKKPGVEVDNFAGAYLTVVPELYMDTAYPILLYEYGHTIENTLESIINKARAEVENHISYWKCSKCGSYKPPKTTERRGGRELVYVTSTYKDCGHKEVEPYD